MQVGRRDVDPGELRDIGERKARGVVDGSLQRDREDAPLRGAEETFNELGPDGRQGRVEVEEASVQDEVKFKQSAY